jgi:BirA family transcriptional regulator, biotin operon repressor / biotin---[acetyl-CoA-carboxylase] ligase
MRVLRLDTVTSTNEVALRLAGQGEANGLWVIADRQESGRGRGGRGWSSPPGNLYASHLLRLECPLAIAQQLTLLAPVALFDAVAALLGGSTEGSPRLRLKWPNDLLVDGAKVSGILLESAAASPGNLTIVMGFGLNLASHPAGLDQAATHLHAHGCSATPDVALSALADATQGWLERWGQGADFAAIRSAWLERAGPIGEPLSVRASPDPNGPRVFGTFGGLDAAGALLLDHAGGSRSTHHQGDVALGAEDR